MSKQRSEITLTVTVTFKGIVNASDPAQAQEVCANVRDALLSWIDSGPGLTPEDADAYTERVQVSANNGSNNAGWVLDLFS